MDLLAPEATTEHSANEETGEERRREAPAAPPAFLTRRTFLGAAGAAVVGMGLYAGEIARHELVIERRSFRIENLPEVFSGIRIAQISDLHYAAYTEPFFIEHVVRQVNALKPDIVLLTGDFVSMAPVRARRAMEYAPLCAELLARLECPMRFGVIGNHDWMVGPKVVREAMTDVGIRMLYNEYLPIERSGRRIWLSGLADALSPDIDIDLAVPPTALADREPVILMGHEPDTLPAVAKYGIDLMLSGHTHGGQVRLPFTRPLFLPPLGMRYVAGPFSLGRTQLYVNRGIGAVGLPFRLNCPPEITELTLLPA